MNDEKFTSGDEIDDLRARMSAAAKLLRAVLASYPQRDIEAALEKLDPDSVAAPLAALPAVASELLMSVDLTPRPLAAAMDLAQLRAEVQRRTRNENTLRRLLWLRHADADHGLYGDDGEMQCGACAIDFRRMPPDEISAAFERDGLRQLVADRAALDAEWNAGIEAASALLYDELEQARDAGCTWVRPANHAERIGYSAALAQAVDHIRALKRSTPEKAP